MSATVGTANQGPLAIGSFQADSKSTLVAADQMIILDSADNNNLKQSAISNLAAATPAFVYKGTINAATNPNYPAAIAGDVYDFSAAGRIGGAVGPEVQGGVTTDTITCIAATAAGTHAAVGANWNIKQANIQNPIEGPETSTDNAIARYNGAGGSAVQDSSVTIDDSDNFVTPGNITGDNITGEIVYTEEVRGSSNTGGTSLNLFDSNGNGMTVANGGDVGIGTESITAGYKVDIRDSAVIAGLSIGDATQTSYSLFNMTSNSGFAQIIKSGAANAAAGANSGFGFYNSNAGIYFHPSGTNLIAMTSAATIIGDGTNNHDFQVYGQNDNNTLYVDASTDRVGIGTATPSVKLDVEGEGLFSDNLTVEGQVITETITGVSTTGGEVIRIQDPSGNGLTLHNGGNIGINTDTPQTKLHVATTSTSSPRGILSAQHSTDGNGARLHLRKSKGTEASPSAVSSGNVLGQVISSGYDGSDYIESGMIEFLSSGVIGTNRIPSEIRFHNSTNAAPSVLTERMRINQTGDIGIGVSTHPIARLEIVQNGASRAIPILSLEQTDVSEEFIRFIGTSANANLTQSLVEDADVTTATLQGWAKVFVQDDGNQLTDQAYFMPLYTLA